MDYLRQSSTVEVQAKVVRAFSLRFKVGVVSVAVVLIGLGLLFVFRDSPHPSVRLLPNGMPPPKVSLFAKWVPFSWGWAWRLRDWGLAVLGQKKTIKVDAAVIDCQSFAESTLSALAPGAPEYTGTNGLRIWIVRDPDLKSLRKRLTESHDEHLMCRPRVITGHGMQATISLSTKVMVNGAGQDVGLTASFLPLIRRHSVELSTSVVLSEAATNVSSTVYSTANTNFVSIHTNFAMAAAIQLPPGSGIFLLEGAPSNHDARRIGMVIAAEVPER